MKICAASHTREHLIYGSSFRERKEKRLATPSYITKAKGDCLQPRYKPLGNLPSHRTCQPVVILPTLLYHMPPPLGHKQIPGTQKAFVHSGCFGDVLNFRVGGGAWPNTESFEVKHAWTSVFHLSFPGFMVQVTL